MSIFWIKKPWHFYLSLSLLPSLFFILVQFFGPGNLVDLISVGNVLGPRDLRGLERKEVRVVSGGFSSSFSAQRYIFLVFLSGLLDLIVLEFYYILILYFATQNKLQVK